MIAIDLALARKVLSVVDAGLCSGLGRPEPGKMCVEAAVCYAMGVPHSDRPTCVAPALRYLKIKLNDCSWSSNEARAKGMRRLAIAQLGSAGVLDEKEFERRVAEMSIRITVPRALIAASKIHPDKKHKLALIEAAKRCQGEGNLKAAAYAAIYAADEAAYAAYAASAATAAAYAASAATAAAYAAYAAEAAEAAEAASAASAAEAASASVLNDSELAGFAEAVVRILIDMKAPGCAFLHLTER